MSYDTSYTGSFGYGYEWNYSFLGGFGGSYEISTSYGGSYVLNGSYDFTGSGEKLPDIIEFGSSGIIFVNGYGINLI